MHRRTVRATAAAAALAGAAAFAVDYYVDASGGNDANDGLTPTSAFATINRAVAAADTGTVIHILPGTYRESIHVGKSGTAAAPIVFRGEDTNGAVIVSGAEPSSSLVWTRLASNSIGLPSYVDPTNIFMADISAWGVSNYPELIIWEDGTNRVHLPKAREPDWEVTTEWKYHENWWNAESGDSNYLFDASDDPTGAYTRVEPGHLGWINGFTNSFLTGAVLFATDGLQGHYTFRRLIVEHCASGGWVRVSQPVSFDDVLPGFGSNTKYFVEGLPQLLDQTGEWCVVASSGRLYLWPPGNTHPTNLHLELARRGVGFDLTDCSHVHLENLVIQDINDLNAGYTGPDGAVRLENYGPGVDLVLDHVLIRDCGVGIRITGDGGAGVISNVVIRNCEVSHCEGLGLITLYWPAGPTNPPGIRCLRIQTNEFHHLGFRPRIDMGIGILVESPHQLLFQGNRVHHVMQNGMQLDGGYDTLSLVCGNIFEHCCQGAADCAGLKVWADGSAVRDLLIMRNIFRHNYGWAWAAQQIDWWETSRGKLAGFGAYCDIVASDDPATNAVVVYRNESYDNGNAGFYLNECRHIALLNNVCADCPRGVVLEAAFADGMNSSNTVMNNLFLVNGTNPLFHPPDSALTVHCRPDVETNLRIDHNLYDRRGPAADMVHYTNADWDYTVYTNLAAVRAATPWEGNGADAATDDFVVVDRAAHDFNLPLSSPAVDLGSPPTAATALLARLEASLGVEITEAGAYGSNYDAGAYECRPAPFAITAACWESDAMVLSWTSVYGAAYATESCTDLCAGIWNSNQTVGSAGYGTCWTAAPGGQFPVYWRVRLLGPQ